MASERLQDQINFILSADQLKSVERMSNLLESGRAENTAEHSWHVALMAVVMSEHADLPVDLARVLQLLLVHDLVEIHAGDTYVYDDTAILDQEAREQEAAEEIFGLLPEDQSRELKGFWQEFEARLTPEARFAGAMDRLMPLLHSYHEKGKTWREQGITPDQVIERVKPIQEGSEELWEFAKGLIDRAVREGYFPDGTEDGAYFRNQPGANESLA